MAKKGNKYKGYEPGEAYDPTGVSKYLGLGRPIDFGQKVNKLAMMATIFLCVAITLWKTSGGMDSGEAVMFSLTSGLGFLLSYMIAQELDPDRQLGGIIGGALTVIGYYFFGAGNIIVLLWLLFVLRMLNRSSGDRHRIADNVIIIGSAVWRGKEGFWVYPLLTGAAYILESQIKGGYFRSLYLAGISLAGLAIAEFSKEATVLTMEMILVNCLAIILFLPEIRIAEYTQAKGDKNGKRLFPKRLQATMGFFCMMLVAAIFLHGNEAGKQLLPGTMAAMGCGLYLLVALMRHQVSFNKY